MGIGAAIGGIASGVLGASSAGKAAKAQQAAAQNQTALEKYIYDETVRRFEPFYQGGLDYNNALRYELLGGDVPMVGGTNYDIEEIQVEATNPQGPGKGPPPLDPRVWIDPYGPRNPNNLIRPENVVERGGTLVNQRGNQNSPAMVTKYRVGGQNFDTMAEAQQWAKDNQGGSAYKGYQATPMFRRALSEGQAAIDSSAASRGNVFSGATLEAQQTLGTDLALQDYGNYLNRLTGQAAQGQAAAGNIATAGSNYASGAGAAMGAAGNAQAAGYIGQANALTGAINNAFGAFGYMNGGNNFLRASNGITVPQSTMNSVQALF